MPYVRRLTEARREQNRQAQKRFKEKQRQRRRYEKPSTEGTGVTIADYLLPEQGYAPTAVESSQYTSAGQFSDSTVGGLPDTHNGYWTTSDLRHVVDSAFKDLDQPLIDQGEPTAGWRSVSPSIDIAAQAFEGVLTALAPAVYLPADPSAIDMRAMWPIPLACYHETYTPPRDTRVQSAAHLAYEAQPSNMAALAETVPSGRLTFRRERTDPSHTRLPCPHLNHLQLLGESTFAATMSIALSLGIVRSSFINDHPSTFPLASLTDLTYLKPDLQPTIEQRTLAHPCYLDCILFPGFRSRAIELSSRGQLDHCSLFLDFSHGGLVCHGSRWANVKFGRSMESGWPWSRQSWEARPWFLRKWRFLIRDEDDNGILASAQRWSSLREKDVLMGVGTEDVGSVFSRHGCCNVGVRQIYDDPVIW